MPATTACPDCEERGQRNPKCTLCHGSGKVEFRIGSSTGFGRGSRGNTFVKVDNITFDSLSESRHYAHLKTLERNGMIHDFQVHPRFKLNCPGADGEPKVVALYEADFSYYDRDGNYHVVDVKGHKTALYELKKKWMALQGIEIEEIQV